MRRVQLLFFFSLLWISSVSGAVQCLISSPNQPRTTSQCTNNWCKMHVSSDGQLEQSCDVLGDCRRNTQLYYNPYQDSVNNVQVMTCVSSNGRKLCCCNYNYCNSTVNLVSLGSLAFSFLFYYICM